jgi:hypothetical protein
MMGKSKLLIILMFMFQWTSAQQTKQKPLQFQVMVQAGLLEGEKGSAFQVHVINGVRLNQWSIGVGTGLDYYGFRSVPLYLDIRRMLVAKPTSPFLYLNAGTHFTWLNAEQQPEWETVRNRPGLLLETGLGYQVPIKQHALYFSAGYSLKSMTQEITSEICPFLPPCVETTSRFDYTFRRISVRAGFRF